MTIPNQSDGNLNLEEQITPKEEPLSLGLTEVKVAEILGNRIENGKTFWDKELDLTKIRDNNEKRWLNKNLEVNNVSLYEHQVPYRDNRIFLSIDTLTSSLVAKIPYPEVTEANDTDASRELADNFAKVLYRRAEDIFLKGTIQMIVRHLLMGYRLGVGKWYWDFEAGRLKDDGSFTGDPMVKYIRPQKIVIEEETEAQDNPRLVAEMISNTVEELGYKYPDKKDNLMKTLGASPGNRVMMGHKVDYWETWFTFMEEGKKKEGLAWKYKDIIFDYGLNPYWNYDNQKSNFLDQPTKPYVFFNFLNQGKWIFDDTSLTEQAATLQDILEKRGRQIVENADDAKSTLIMNTQQIDGAAIQRYVHNPVDVIAVKGDVRTAVNRIPPRELAKYVLEDKYDARREIDNIFGTHGPLRGEKTESPTLGQEVMSQRSDLGRLNTLTEAIEKGATQLFKGITQLYKVFADEEHVVKYVGEDTGRTTFIDFSKDKIEDGIEIRVRAGSIKLEDKLTDRSEAVELAKIGGRIDPYTFAEKWHIEKPREFAKRLFFFLFDPQRYAAEVLQLGESGGDQEAMQDIQRISSGERVPPKQNPTKEYLAYYNQFVQSPAFKQLDPEVQALHIQHLKETMMSAKQGLGQKPQGGGMMGKIKGMFQQGGQNATV